jgi:hypothetical protein
MTDITVSSTTFSSGSRSWLLCELDGLQGPVPRLSGVLNFALFTAGTHYPAGYLPSGLVLGRVTSGGKLGPYSDAASDGRQTAVGILYHDVAVPASTSQPVVAALVDCFAVVSEARLPSGHGLDAAGKADLSKLVFRA